MASDIRYLEDKQLKGFKKKLHEFRNTDRFLSESCAVAAKALGYYVFKDDNELALVDIFQRQLTIIAKGFFIWDTWLPTNLHEFSEERVLNYLVNLNEILEDPQKNQFFVNRLYACGLLSIHFMAFHQLLITSTEKQKKATAAIATILKPFTKNLSLPDLLSMPYQRIGRYELFCRDLAGFLKNLPQEHPAKIAIESLLKKMQKVASTLNTAMKNMDGVSPQSQLELINTLRASFGEALICKKEIEGDAQDEQMQEIELVLESTSEQSSVKEESPLSPEISDVLDKASRVFSYLNKNGIRVSAVGKLGLDGGIVEDKENCFNAMSKLIPTLTEEKFESIIQTTAELANSQEFTYPLGDFLASMNLGADRMAFFRGEFLSVFLNSVQMILVDQSQLLPNSLPVLPINQSALKIIRALEEKIEKATKELKPNSKRLKLKIELLKELKATIEGCSAEDDTQLKAQIGTWESKERQDHKGVLRTYRDIIDEKRQFAVFYSKEEPSETGRFVDGLKSKCEHPIAKNHLNKTLN